MTPAAVQAETIRSEDFDDGFFEFDVNPNTTGTDVYHFFHGDWKRDMPGTGAAEEPRLHSGGHLDLRVPRSSGDRDRIEFRLVHGTTDNDDRLKFNQTRKYSFRLYIDSSTERPDGKLSESQRWVHFSQIWQRGATGTVPFVISMRPISNNRMGLYATSKAHGESSITDALGVLDKGRWHTIEVQVTPRWKNHKDGKGRLKVYFNGSKKVDRDTWFATAPGINGAQDRFDVRMGIYRKAQDKKLRILIDDCWYGS